MKFPGDKNKQETKPEREAVGWRHGAREGRGSNPQWWGLQCSFREKGSSWPLSCFPETPAWKSVKGRLQGPYTPTRERGEETGAKGSLGKESPFKKPIPKLILHVVVGALVILHVGYRNLQAKWNGTVDWSNHMEPKEKQHRFVLWGNFYKRGFMGQSQEINHPC